MEKPRMAGIETFRVFAILAVICLHTEPFHRIPQYQGCFEFINYFCRFAVPFYFLTSGFFWGKKLQTGAPVWNLFFNSGKQLLLLWGIWSLFYGLAPTSFPLKTLITHGSSRDWISWLLTTPSDTLTWIQQHKLTFLLQGTSTPLWFLMSLAMALLILSCFVYFKKEKFLLGFALILFLIGLLGGSYSKTPLGISFPFELNTRNGPFLSTLFVAVGWRLSFLKKLPALKWAFLLFLGGLLLNYTEFLFLLKCFNVQVGRDYVLGTIPFGVGAFLLALHAPDLGKGTFLPEWGKLVLGIYVTHRYVMSLILLLQNKYFPHLTGTFTWEILFSFVVFFSSAAVVSLLKKNRITRLTVS